jgi:putative heme-binding domain-containing protein
MPISRGATARGGIGLWAVGAVIVLVAVLPLAADVGARANQANPIRGDVTRGRALIGTNNCFDCHRIAERGSRVGPDLSEIGTLRSREVLRQAIVEPDDTVLPEHRYVRAVTRDGTAVAGRLLNQDAFSIQMITVDEQLKSYLKSNLREYAIQQKGLMPSYKDKLTEQQIADLVSYLASLQGDEK